MIGKMSAHLKIAAHIHKHQYVFTNSVTHLQQSFLHTQIETHIRGVTLHSHFQIVLQK